MLDELAVHNLAVLESAQVRPGPGLTVITGETGTGKTMLVGALQVLAGGELAAERIGSHGDEAVVEARFVLEAGIETIVARRRGKGGRTRSYLNGTMASAAELEAFLSGTVEVVAQHDHLRIAKAGEVLSILDGLLDEAGGAVLEEYRRAWSAWLDLQAKAELLGGDHRSLVRERDLKEHEAREIDRAGFTKEEIDSLESGVRRLRHARELVEFLGSSSAGLDDAGGSIGSAVEGLRRGAALDPALEALSLRTEALAIELTEVAHDLGSEIASLSVEPGALEQVESRLAVLAHLKRKYGATWDEISEYGIAAKERAGEIGESLELAERVEEERIRLNALLLDLGQALTRVRGEAAARWCRAADEHLRDLGFDTASVTVHFAELDAPRGTGTATPELRFSSDERLAAMPVAKAASGGELSRLVLALRLAAGVGDMPVIAFDEIDAGVGGNVALEVGNKLSHLSRDRQVLCVTHLPQIAAFADTHFVVERLGADARVRRVEGDARLSELTRMLSGIEATASGLSHAEELLRFAHDRSTG